MREGGREGGSKIKEVCVSESCVSSDGKRLWGDIPLI